MGKYIAYITLHSCICKKNIENIIYIVYDISNFLMLYKVWPCTWGIRYAKSLSIQYFIDINLLKYFVFDINFFKNFDRYQCFPIVQYQYQYFLKSPYEFRYFQKCPCVNKRSTYQTPLSRSVIKK